MFLCADSEDSLCEIIEQGGVETNQAVAMLVRMTQYLVLLPHRQHL
jgi:hypothetical protein